MHNEMFLRQFEEKLKSFLKNGPYVLGEQVKLFETSFAKYIGAEHCVSVANGTDALELAIKALDLPKGAEIITAANAGMYSTISILNSGYKPQFVDISAEGYGLDISKALASITKNTKAVIYTHLFGRAADLTNFKAELDKKGIFLIEDCAQSHGARIGSKLTGTFGHIAAFSFYPTKNLGALGDGGAIVTNDKKLSDKVLRLRQYGWSKKYFVSDSFGRNSRLDEIQAIFLNVKLAHLDSFNAKRVEVATKYKNGIKNDKLVIRNFPTDGSFVAHLFVIELKNSQDRSRLMSYLNENKIACDIHYPVPDHKQDTIKNEFSVVRLEITEDRAEKILTLPCFPELDNEKISFIIETLNKW